MAAAECVTELIVTNAVCSIVDAQAPDKQAMNTLIAYYLDVGDRLDETVVWLGNRSYINTLYIASTRWGKNVTSGAGNMVSNMILYKRVMHMSDLKRKKPAFAILEILRKYTDEDHRLSQKDIVDILKTEYDMDADRET